MNRRQLLRACGATGIGLTTGCLGRLRGNATEQRTTEDTASDVQPIPEYDATHHSVVPDVQELEQLTHEVTNRARRKHSKSEISYDPELANIARLHSRDMARNEFFSHENQDGESHNTRLSNHGYYSDVVYENILVSESVQNGVEVREAAQMAVDSWLNSPPHREALLREHVTEEGIGVYVTAEPRIYWTVELSKYDVDRQTPTQ